MDLRVCFLLVLFKSKINEYPRLTGADVCQKGKVQAIKMKTIQVCRNRRHLRLKKRGYKYMRKEKFS